jgi:hypothetical protein
VKDAIQWLRSLLFVGQIYLMMPVRPCLCALGHLQQARCARLLQDLFALGVLERPLDGRYPLRGARHPAIG